MFHYMLDVLCELFISLTAYVLGGGSFNVTLRQAKEKTPFLAYANLFTCDDVLDIIPCPFAPHCKSFFFFKINQHLGLLKNFHE